MMEKERTYIAIDLKSFYASVECNWMKCHTEGNSEVTDLLLISGE